jgi:hypothetical protein
LPLNATCLRSAARALRLFHAVHQPAGRASFPGICRQGCGSTKASVREAG